MAVSRCAVKPRPTPYCVGPAGRKLAYNVRYSYNAGFGGCARFRGPTYVWCFTNGGRYAYTYCCGTMCAVQDPGAGMASCD
jgi:hypothetical protein